MVIPIYTLKLVSLQLPHRVAHAVRSQTCQQLHLSIMPSFAHYFKEKDFSDCELIVQQRPKGHDVQEEAPKRTCTGTAARPVLEPWRQPQRLVAFPAHQMILCTCKYFNAQAQRWQVPASSLASSNQHPASGAKPVKLYLNLTINSEDELPAAEAVIAGLYGVAYAFIHLRHDQLVQALIIADMIGAAEAAEQVNQCLKTAAASQQGLSVEALEMLAGLPAWPECLLQLLPTIVAHASCCKISSFDLVAIAAADCKGVLQRLLLSIFGDLQAVWRDEKLKTMLLQLPCPAMQLLLSSDQLQVPSEDIVLYTAQEYVVQQRKEPVRGAARSALAGLVRAPHLSDGMLHHAALSDDNEALLMGEYLKQLRHLLLLRRTLMDRAGVDFQDGLTRMQGIPKSWQLGQRQQVPMLAASVVWRIPVQHLKQTSQQAFTDKKAMYLYSPNTPPISGFDWKLQLSFQVVEKGVQLGVYVVPSRPTQSFYHSIQCVVKCHKLPPLHLLGVSLSSGMGWSKFFRCKPLADGWDEAVWAAKGLPTAGDLVLKLEVWNVF